MLRRNFKAVKTTYTVAGGKAAKPAVELIITGPKRAATRI